MSAGDFMAILVFAFMAIVVPGVFLATVHAFGILALIGWAIAGAFLFAIYCDEME